MLVRIGKLLLGFLNASVVLVQLQLFSTAADIITNDRGRLNPERAEKILFCHENFSLIQYQY